LSGCGQCLGSFYDRKRAFGIRNGNSGRSREPDFYGYRHRWWNADFANSVCDFHSRFQWECKFCRNLSSGRRCYILSGWSGFNSRPYLERSSLFWWNGYHQFPAVVFELHGSHSRYFLLCQWYADWRESLHWMGRKLYRLPYQRKCKLPVRCRSEWKHRYGSGNNFHFQFGYRNSRTVICY
jgi:hypothetical protein